MSSNLPHVQQHEVNPAHPPPTLRSALPQWLLPCSFLDVRDFSVLARLHPHLKYLDSVESLSLLTPGRCTLGFPDFLANVLLHLLSDRCPGPSLDSWTLRSIGATWRGRFLELANVTVYFD